MLASEELQLWMQRSCRRAATLQRRFIRCVQTEASELPAPVYGWSERYAVASCELSLGCPPGPGRGSWSCDASAILGRTG
jgi:hypothetical protein